MPKPKKTPDVGGIAPTFTVASFASTSDSSQIVYNNSGDYNNNRKTMIQKRRGIIRAKKGKK